MILKPPAMIALRIIDELPCAFDVSIEAIGYSIYQTQTTDVSVVKVVTHSNRQDMTPPAFLFLSSTMSISTGKSLPNQTPQTQNHATPPSPGGASIIAPKTSEFRKRTSGTILHHRPSVTALIGATLNTCQALHQPFFATARKCFSSGELQGPTAGGTKTNFPTWRFSRNSRCASAIFSKGNIFATSGFISPRSI